MIGFNNRDGSLYFMDIEFKRWCNNTSDLTRGDSSMVDQKQPSQVEIDSDNQPQDPERRKIIKTIALGGAGLAAFGSAFFFNRSSSEQNEIISATTTTLGNEPAPSTTPSTSTTELSIPSTETNEPLVMSLEDLPTSIEDPGVWLDKITKISEEVYNSGDYSLLDYAHLFGERGTGGWIKQQAEEFERLRRTLGDNFNVTVSAEIIEEVDVSLTDGGGPIRIIETIYIPALSENPLFPNGELKRRLNYSVTPPAEITFIGNGASELVMLYLVNGITIICTYDKDGNCISS